MRREQAAKLWPVMKSIYETDVHWTDEFDDLAYKVDFWPVVKAFSEGADVQLKDKRFPEWTDTPDPSFTPRLKWRVKPQMCPYCRQLLRHSVTGF